MTTVVAGHPAGTAVDADQRDWIVGIVAVGDRARARRARSRSRCPKYVLPGSDLDHDIEGLDHEHPDEMARQMAHRLEVKSSAWPVVAAAIILPARRSTSRRRVPHPRLPVMSEFEQSLARTRAC